MSNWITALLLSPATGEQKSMWPWIVGGIGLVALAAFVVLSIMQKKKTPPDGGEPAMGDEPPAAEPSADTQAPAAPEAPADAGVSEPEDDSQPDEAP